MDYATVVWLCEKDFVVADATTRAQMKKEKNILVRMDQF